ncbi:MAG: NADH-quinone oxidoreductase subunit C [Gammaproteobacteria bacterium]|nr:NADH-quinone oxidoreductase subunit C [Gammaproteobacteria bacterium]MDH5226603.1 NADH-quinone oxidoreductase subunit C [Gammaproteobacteria bacterium]
MNQALEQLAESISGRFAGQVTRVPSRCGELTFEVAPAALVAVCTALRDEAEWSFEQLIDLCGVDYSLYGVDEWNTDTATFRGFSRGRQTSAGPAVERSTLPGAEALTPEALTPTLSHASVGEGVRFAVVYHLLSVKHNRRLRLRTFCEPGEPPLIDSVIEIWKAADWFEREAFDLFGILFRGHPDLRRLLTDYGFIGHPFRKDFPLSGNVEVRYDPVKGRVVYEPVSIEPRTLVPRVIREDNRYEAALKDAPQQGHKNG